MAVRDRPGLAPATVLLPLGDEAVTIKEVAAALHFNDAYHFSKTFKARTGRSPSRWRQA